MNPTHKQVMCGVNPALLNHTTRAIIQTAAFYDAIGHTPLTATELYKFLLQTKKSETPSVSLSSFLQDLACDWPMLGQYIACRRGFYFLRSNPDGYTRRVQVAKTGIAKWRIAKKMIRVISLLPYTRMVAVTGSLALHMTHRESDIDILIGARHGRLWTTRILTSIFMQALGKRRHGRHIKDRICLNHYISDGGPMLRPQNLFSAHIYSTFLPVWSKEGAEEKFSMENERWAKSYIAHSRHKIADLRSLGDVPAVLSLAMSVLELVLLYTGGSFLEYIVRFVQRKKIGRRTRDSSAEGEVIFDDEALVFHHPRPKDQEALHLYRENLTRLELPA